MKIRINPKGLTESPYTYEKPKEKLKKDSIKHDDHAEPVDKPVKDYFRFDEATITALANELIIAKPTSLMISGFRGVGKTSFIERIQEHLDTNPANDKLETVFVTLNFSKYEEHRYVIRKLIRNLYLAIKDKPTFLSLQKPNNKGEAPNGAQKLASLYKKTYLDVQSQLNIKDESSQEIKTAVAVTQKVGAIAEILLGAGAATALMTNLGNTFGKYAIGGLLIAFTVLKAIQFTVTIINKRVKTNSKEQIEKTIYDDEIADFLFRDLLKSLKDDFRLIFVLDELDKIQDVTEINKVINELKPFLLSGHCNFILVSGQDLYYRFFNATFESDPVLSTIFSRTQHIGLPRDIGNMVDHFVSLVSKGKDDGDFFYDLQQSLIFNSNRNPRKLVSHIRQLISRATLLREDKLAVFELEMTSIDQEKLMKDKVLEETISGILPSLIADLTLQNNPPLLDLFISQLYIWANRLYYLEEEKEHAVTTFLNEVEPWQTKLPQLQYKRQVFLEVFLNNLTRSGFFSVIDATTDLPMRLVIDWSAQQGGSGSVPKKKSPPISKSVKKTPPAPDTADELTDDHLIIEEPEAEYSKERASDVVPEEQFKAKEKIHLKKQEEQEFQEAHDSFVNLASIIYLTLSEIAESRKTELTDGESMAFRGKWDSEVSFSFHDGDLTLAPYIEEVMLGKHRRLIDKLGSIPFQDGVNPFDRVSAANLVEMQRMKHTLLIGYLMSLPHLFAQDVELFWQESVALQERRIPNTDLLIASNDASLASVAFKVVVVEAYKDLDQGVVNDCVDFLRRVNNITEKKHKLMLVIYSETVLEISPSLTRKYQDQLNEALQQQAEFIPYIEIGVFDLVNIGQLKYDFQALRQDVVIDFTRLTRREIEYGSNQPQVPYELVKGSFGTHFELKGSGLVTFAIEQYFTPLNSYEGNLWLQVCHNHSREVGILLHLNLVDPKTQDVAIKGFMLKQSGEKVSNKDERQVVHAYNGDVEVVEILPDRSLKQGDWDMDMYNLYDAFERNYWQSFELSYFMFIELIAKSEKSTINISYFKFHFDAEDMKYEGLGLLAD